MYQVTVSSSSARDATWRGASGTVTMMARSGITPTGALRQTIVIVPLWNLPRHSASAPSVSTTPRVPVPVAMATERVARRWPVESTTVSTAPSAPRSKEVGEA